MNLSERGIFFTTKLPLDLGTTVEFLLKMPQEISDEAEPSRRWTGHVVRVVPANVLGGRLGVGVQFDCYETVQGLVIEELRGATSRQAQNLS